MKNTQEHLSAVDQQNLIQRIVDLFQERGDEIYADELVTQLQHATQCGQLAKQEGESDTLVVAALLHDIGHLLSETDLPASCEQNLDDAHEQAGYDFLKSGFGEDVAELVRLHVVAKRYLCTHETGYIDTLSPTSKKSFLDQGGLLSESETAEFEAHPHFEDAIKLRKWDDLAKDSELEEIQLQTFQPEIENVLAQMKSA